MPGQTNNTDFLGSFNQIIQALNDLQLLIETGDPPQNLAVLVEAIADNIEAMRSTQETRSIAAVTALNTNFEGLINQLKKCCASSCGASGRTYPESTSGIEGDDPPTNLSGEIVWETVEGGPIPGIPGQPVYYNRKCKVANMLQEDMEIAIQALVDTGGVAQTSFDIALAIVGYILGELITPIPIADGIALDLTLAYLDQEIDLDDLISQLIANREDLVCALYNSTGNVEAIANYTTVLINAGIVAANITLVTTIMVADFLNYLYFKSGEYVEAKIANYTPPVDCSVCGDCALLSIGTGFEVSSGPLFIELDSWTGTTFDFAYVSINSQFANGGDSGPFGPYCDAEQSITGSLISGSAPNWVCLDGSYDGTNGWTGTGTAVVYGPSTTPPSNVTCRHVQTYGSQTGFVIRIDV